MDRWVGLICDATGATVVAVEARPSGPVAISGRTLDWDGGGPNAAARAELTAFVRANQLRRCAARVLFAGAGAVVQKLRLPPMKPRHQLDAVKTRLVNYAGGRPLLVGLRADVRPAEPDAPIPTLAAGVDRELTRAIVGMCRAAGLRVSGVTAAAAAFEPPPETPSCLQLLVAERTTAMQVFDRGQMIACRDVLIGRRDFVAAYQRPILTDGGPLTLSAEQAARIVSEIGIPTEAIAEVADGISAAQVWPLLNPVLQRMRQEVTQTLSQSGLPNNAAAAISVLGWPRMNGLMEYLCGELHLLPAHTANEAGTRSFLIALRCPTRADGELDLRPMEDRFVARMWRPAAAVGLAAAFVFTANLTTPRQAEAAAQAIAPVTQRLERELSEARAQRAELEQRLVSASQQLGRETALKRALPAQWPTTALLKLLLKQTPTDATLERVELREHNRAIECSIRATYQGPTAASLLAAAWCRRLTEIEPRIAAEVASVGGSGRDAPVSIDLRVTITAGTRPAADGTKTRE